MYLYIAYPKCSTCKKAKEFLLEKGISFIDRDINKEKPTHEELKEWIYRSGLPIKRFFNTSGNLYKELHLKEKLTTLSEEEQIELLSTSGMLIRRPLLISEDKVLVGFKEESWNVL